MGCGFIYLVKDLKLNIRLLRYKGKILEGILKLSD